MKEFVTLDVNNVFRLYAVCVLCTLAISALKKNQIKLSQTFKKLKEQKTSTPFTSGIMTVSEKLEFEIGYVKSPIADPECDPLGWWKTNSIHYPFLAKIAKKYLSICATSCPSEGSLALQINCIHS